MDIKDIANKYIKIKKEENELNKESKKLNSEIKQFMIDAKEDVIDTDSGRLVLSRRTSESFDEENLIEYLKSSGNAKGIVKKKEYIDYDALESAIYREKLDIETVKKLNDFKIEKVTEVLSIK